MLRKWLPAPLRRLMRLQGASVGLEPAKKDLSNCTRESELQRRDGRSLVANTFLPDTRGVFGVLFQYHRGYAHGSPLIALLRMYLQEFILDADVAAPRPQEE